MHMYFKENKSLKSAEDKETLKELKRENLRSGDPGGSDHKETL
jgi:hypothetical protein